MSLRTRLRPAMPEAYTEHAINNRWSTDEAIVEVLEGNDVLIQETVQRKPQQSDVEFRREAARVGLNYILASGAAQ